MNFYIYKITNLIKNKIYIGKAGNSLERWEKHKIIAKGGKEKYPKHYYPIHAALNKYGIENFTFEIIENYEEEQLSYEAEKKWINYYQSNDSNYGYNLTIGGRGIISNKPVSLETRKKISAAQKGKARRKNYTNSDELKNKMKELSLHNKNILTESIKIEILDLFNSGNFTKKQLAEKFSIKIESIRYIIAYHNNNGFKTKEEKRRNKSVSKLGKKHSCEHNEKISKSLKGIIFTDTRKMNISKSLTGKIMSQETKDKIAATLSGIPNYIDLKKQIIEDFITGKYKQIELSKKFNISYDVVKKIIKQYRINNA